MIYIISLLQKTKLKMHENSKNSPLTFITTFYKQSIIIIVGKS